MKRAASAAWRFGNVPAAMVAAGFPNLPPYSAATRADGLFGCVVQLA